MHPFSDIDFGSVSTKRINLLINEIQSLTHDYILKAPISQLEEYFVEKYKLEPLRLKIEDVSRSSSHKIEIDVQDDQRRYFSPGTKPVIPGTRIDIKIPYEGPSDLWRVRSNYSSMDNYPEINKNDKEISFSIEFANESIESMVADGIVNIYQKVINKLIIGINNINEKVEEYNNHILDIIREYIQYEIEEAQSVSEILSPLPIPMIQSETVPTIPMIRKKRPVVLPPAAKEQYEPEPILEQKEYEHILKILKNLSLVIERNPSSFASLEEEAIRDNFLFHLNGHYEGSATGETFNAAGKTDILIREGDRNVFIAECKFWRGQKSFNKAINQLLSYLTWRDSKCALLVFNKNKNSDAVYDKLHRIMELRPEHSKTLSHNKHGDSCYILVKETEPGREITVTVQVYDVPS